MTIHAGASVSGTVTATGPLTLGTNTFTKAAMSSGEIALDNGTNDTPGVHFYNGNNTNWGVDNSSGILRFATNLDESGGNVQFSMAASTFSILSDTGVIKLGTSSDTILARDGAANTLALKNANTAQEFRVYAGNGSYVSPIKTVNETLTIAAAATTDSATTIPGGSVIVACAVRVLTAIPTAANFTMTTATGGTTMSTAPVLVAANTTDKGTAGGVFYQSANTKVRITPNATPANTAGSVRLAIYYIDTVAPTS